MAFKPQRKQAKTAPKKITASQRKTLEEKKSLELEKEILEEELIYRKGQLTLKDLIAPAAFEVESSYIRIGSKFARTLFVLGYPRYIYVGWFAPIINYSASFDIGIFFAPMQTQMVLKQLRDKVGRVEAEISSGEEHGKPRDPAAQTALQDMEKLRDDLTQGIEHFFSLGLYVTLYANSVEELDKLTEDIEAIFGTKLVYTKRVFYQAEQGFNSTLPLGQDELEIGFNMNTSPAAASFPFISSDLTSETGILYGINRHNNSLILFDRFSLQNANEVVFATSGAGKSFAIKLEVLRSMMMGTDVIVIDPEKEYQHLCEAVGGTYINISLSSTSRINPFDLPRPIGEQVSTADIIRSAVITLKGLMRLMLGALTPEEDSIIDRALLESYAKKDITPQTDLKTAEAPTMRDLQDVLEGMVGATSLVEKIRKYTEGTFSGLLNHPTNVEMRNQLVVFSVRDLEDELRPMAIYTIVNYIWNVVRSQVKKRILVIDEAWWLMQHEDSARFVFALAKRCRKYYLGLTTITQDVNDFLNSEYGKAILTNSSIQLLLKQSPAAIDLVQKTFMLTEGEKYLLLESAPGEGIFFAGQKHVAIKVVASYSEDQLITTDPRQLLEIEAAKKEFAAEQEKSSSANDITL
ncbi:ATP-binding protein [Candidatus Uhrbacteria bacterium]|nr:ATP-binding protein [Candidatus Uhrbacteria bacterium]